MKRVSVWFLSTLSAVVVLFGYHTSTSGALATSAAPATTTSPAATSSGTDGSASSGTTGSSPSSSGSASGSSSGSGGTTVTGEVAQTRWGPVQVALTVSGGKITAVSVPQYPQGNGRDVEINNYALPILVQETTDAQSADIDMVSGATVTSDGYVQSLQSALDEAGL